MTMIHAYIVYCFVGAATAGMVYMGYVMHRRSIPHVYILLAIMCVALVYIVVTTRLQPSMKACWNDAAYQSGLVRDALEHFNTFDTSINKVDAMVNLCSSVTRLELLLIIINTRNDAKMCKQHSVVELQNVVDVFNDVLSSWVYT
jgi:hypothetical protein